MFQGSNNLTSGLPPEPIAEDQAVTFAEDEHRLLHDPEGAATPTRSATYGTLRGSADASTAPRDTNINTDTDTPRNKLNFGTVMYLCVLGIVTASGLVALFGCTRDASGPVSLQTDSNFPFATTSKHPLRPTPLWGNVEKPYPTGAWWLNLVMGDGDNPVAPLPYTFKATRYGVGVSYSAMRRTVSLTRVEDTYSTDLNVSVVEGVTGHHIVRYDDLTVTVQHDATDGGYFQTLAARGSPYMTFEFTGTTPRIKSHGKILELNGNEPKVGSSVYDTTLKLSLSNSETWLVFTSESVAWTVSSYSEIQAQTPFSGVVRVAMLPHSWDEDSETILKKHAHAFTRGGEVSITVTGDKMEMRYEWNKHGFDDLLMMALPHHMDILELGQGDGILLNNSYQTIKGPMTGIVGSVWIMTDTLTDIAWTARTPLAEAAKGIDDPLLTLSWEGQVKKALAADLNVVPSAPDIYGFGKECSRLARLALIADELGDVAARDAVVVSLNAVLVPWMKNNNENLLVYDKTWGGVVTNDGLNDVNADFGNAWYNDHTYHYGYVLYAVAVLAKFQPYFYSMHKKQIDFLVADVADDGKRAQKFFPKARQKFCFLMRLMSIPAGLFDVAFAAADSDDSGTIDQEELERLVHRLAAPVVEEAEADEGKAREAAQLAGHKRLVAKWFGEDGKGSVPREEFAAFVRDLRLDIKTVECRLYSRTVRTHHDDIDSNPNRPQTTSWLNPRWLLKPWEMLWGGLTGTSTTVGSDGNKHAEGDGEEEDGKRGWWNRYASESILLADLALTLVSTCDPRELPVHLARVQAIKKKRATVPLRDALILHEVLEDHAEDLEDALGLYCKATSRGAVGQEDFVRAAKVVSGKDLSAECIWVVFKMFDKGGDGQLQYGELLSATRARLRRLPGLRESPPGFKRLVECVRGE